MSAKHTPGPWVQDEAGICDGDGKWGVVAQVCLPEFYWGRSDDDELPPEVVAELSANARLIAAAPDLLASLRELKELFRFALLSTTPDIASDGMAFIRKAEEAIAKATGQ